MENKQKRYYKVGEMVWSVPLKKQVKIKEINRETKEAVVTELKDKKEIVEHTFALWEIDKLKYKAKEKHVKSKKSSTLLTKGSLSISGGRIVDTGSLRVDHFVDITPTVYVAKLKEDAVIPTKRDEDAGYDLYANIEGVEIEGKIVHELYLPAHETTLVPTGIAMALPKTHYLNAKHERGSTAVPAISVLAGVIDSGYRGEIFVALNPLHKDVLITSETDKVEDLEHVILYPYSKAIAQATIDLVPKVKIEEIDFESLKSIESERGDTKLGQSGK